MAIRYFPLFGRLINLLSELLNKKFLSNRLLRDLNLEQRMLVLDFCLALRAEVEVVTENALVSYSQNAELVFAV